MGYSDVRNDLVRALRNELQVWVMPLDGTKTSVCVSFRIVRLCST